MSRVSGIIGLLCSAAVKLIFVTSVLHRTDAEETGCPRTTAKITLTTNFENSCRHAGGGFFFVLFDFDSNDAQLRAEGENAHFP